MNRKINKYKMIAGEITRNYKDYNNVQKIIELADTIRQKSKNDPLEPLVPIIQIVKSFGFNVYIQNLPSYLSGFMIVNDNLFEIMGTDKVISISVTESVKNRRFIVAHELAHYLFDFSEKEAAFHNVFLYDDISNYQAEEVVNIFAASLLIPEQEFIKKYNEYRNNYPKRIVIAELSDDFLVPFELIKFKIKIEKIKNSVNC